MQMFAQMRSYLQSPTQEVEDGGYYSAEDEPSKVVPDSRNGSKDSQVTLSGASGDMVSQQHKQLDAPAPSLGGIYDNGLEGPYIPALSSSLKGPI